MLDNICHMADLYEWTVIADSTSSIGILPDYVESSRIVWMSFHDFSGRYSETIFQSCVRDYSRPYTVQAEHRCGETTDFESPSILTLYLGNEWKPNPEEIETIKQMPGPESLNEPRRGHERSHC
eukprot:Blabericola_migrator_1__7709@NODE_3936_length_1418_cov_4_630644_g2435_i0_p1_GENE_NODE_3936_length_1418_cov_4_630644_g2435_i0NODE_3936_length_1418_cov_4_630644_g2435_i0_p1_ORF_typecomplete_len124_score5_41_NODE_3936_length_1418_cov_4_630644_g2435_i07211092